jgi:hypothetical protein
VHKVYWLWLDLRLLDVLLVWAAFDATLFHFFDRRIVFHGTEIVPPHRTALAPKRRRNLHGRGRSRAAARRSMLADDARHPHQVRENGYVDCYVAVSDLAEN